MTNNTPTDITLWHCHDARSLRPLWLLEEMGLPYVLKVLPFPPRVHDPDFLSLNVLGTVPYFVDGEVTMTESSAICHYLVTRYPHDELNVPVDHPEYRDFLNWLYHSDATLTFPQTLVLRYRFFESDERKNPQVADDYAQWFLARLRRLDVHLGGREYLCADRFTAADVAIGYALYLGGLNGLADGYSDRVKAYLARLQERPALQRAITRGAEVGTHRPF